jgi:hypothetical protein
MAAAGIAADADEIVGLQTSISVGRLGVPASNVSDLCQLPKLNVAGSIPSPRQFQRGRPVRQSADDLALLDATLAPSN